MTRYNSLSPNEPDSFRHSHSGEVYSDSNLTGRENDPCSSHSFSIASAALSYSSYSQSRSSSSVHESCPNWPSRWERAWLNFGKLRTTSNEHGNEKWLWKQPAQMTIHCSSRSHCLYTNPPQQVRSP